MKKIIWKYKDLSIQTKASIWYTFGSVLTKGIALLSTPIFTRIMDQYQYGKYTVFQSWFNILLIFTSLNIFLGGYTKGLITFEDEVDAFTSSSLGLTTFITLIYGIIYALNINFWTKLLGLSPVLMLAMLFELLLMPAFEFWSARARFEYKYRKYVVFSIFISVLSILLGIITGLETKNKVFARVYSDAFAKILIWLPIFIYLMFKGKKFFNKNYWKYDLKFNISLIPHYLSTYALNQSDLLMISKIIGDSQAAYYSIAYTIATMMILVGTSINNALTPYIFKSLRKKKILDIRNTTRVLFIIISMLSIVTMIFAPEIIRIFAGRKYMQAIYVVPPVAASVYFVFLYNMFSTIEYYYQKTIYISSATLFAALVNIGLNFIFLKRVGYYAAGYTTLISYILLSVAHYYFCKRIIRLNISQKYEPYDLKIILYCSVVTLISMMVFSVTYHLIWLRYGVVVLIFIILLYKKKKIIKVFTNLKTRT